MNSLDQFRTAQVQLIKTGVHKEAMLIQHRPHRPVADDNFLRKKIFKV
jgi:hypothetical protein